MLTYAPSLRLGQLNFFKSSDDQMIKKIWGDSKSDILHFSRSAWALAAICRAVYYDTRKELTIWIPNYFCNQSLWPLRQEKIKIQFYPVDENFKPNWAECQRLAKNQQPDIFMLVHYFGLQSDCAIARKFCDSNSCLMIEDCAHVLKPFAEIGKYSDFTFFSPHKLFSIPDGSVLKIAPSAKKYLSLLNQAKDEMDVGFKTDGVPTPWLAKRILQHFLPQQSLNQWREKKNPLDFKHDPDAQVMSGPASMSQFSERELNWLCLTTEEVANSRRENEKSILAEIAQYIEGTPIFSDSGGVPYLALFRCRNEEIAQQNFLSLRKRGLIVQTWPDLAPEIHANPNEHQIAIQLRRTLLTFPVHQGLSAEEIRRLYRGH